MTTLNISLPDSLNDFVEEQAALGGYPYAERLHPFPAARGSGPKDRVELEGKLLAALDGEADEMGQADWDRAKSDLDEQASKLLRLLRLSWTQRRFLFGARAWRSSTYARSTSATLHARAMQSPRRGRSSARAASAFLRPAAPWTRTRAVK